MKLFTTTGALVFSYLGWWLATPLGFGWALVIGGVASLLGVWVGWKLARHFL